ncbi:hypothetical protein Acsp03_46570 [Actinomadura sp. NBRC 104412]|uniref:transcriptional regulator n=1 Tax=Actinomadura sp. NBRC 104412 TaxID=3032203 RepID=UPI0024A18A6C|nr:transcriptional regulator [Actinomadura sp. NBRC 104412]GLZ07191.1 hypothetical protein Acsp03_46570 [Actinomadura sp. NBRC 104412]
MSGDLMVLHALRCVGFASVERLAEATGLPEADVESELIDLAVTGLVTYELGLFRAWGLTDAGRAAAAKRVSDELDAAGARQAVAAAFDDFLVLNPELLDLCGAWQTRVVDGVTTANDHTDAAYDGRVLDLFADFHRRADGVCVDLAAALPRFQRYRDRLTGAITRAGHGDLGYLTDRLDSYHTVWCQLHEDLLVTLGIPRH